MLISKGKMVKTVTFFWPPSAAGKFFELLDQKIAISKGEMVKTAIFLARLRRARKFWAPKIGSDAILHHIQNFKPKKNSEFGKYSEKAFNDSPTPQPKSRINLVCKFCL